MNTDWIPVAFRRHPRLMEGRTLRLYVRARQHRHRILAAAIALGILFMVIHWG